MRMTGISVQRWGGREADHEAKVRQAVRMCWAAHHV
jgi:hypothetical protein